MEPATILLLDTVVHPIKTFIGIPHELPSPIFDLANVVKTRLLDCQTVETKFVKKSLVEKH